MVAVHVAGGTGAGKKRPLQEPHPDWVCACGYDIEIVVRPGHWCNCPYCHARRPT